jgi:hypothetical protein
LRSFIGLPPLKPGTIRSDVMLVTRNSLHTTVSSFPAVRAALRWAG